MTTWNTTYNFNQPSMNFGQAMLYGAFGQLTGMFGGGCFGGGYGIGSYGMGMGGSLFSMMGGCGGFGGFGMYGSGIPDSYVGAQCGLAATNVLFSAIGGAIKSHRAEKAAAQQAAQTASNNVDTLTKEIKALEDENTALNEGGATDGIKSDGTVTAKAKSMFSNETSTYDNALKKLDNYSAKNASELPSCGLTGTSYHINSDATAVINEYKADLTSPDLSSSDETKKAAAQSKKSTAEQKIKEAIVKSEQDYQNDLKAVDAAKKALQDKVKAKIKENSDNITKKQADLEKAQKEIEKAKAQENLNKKCDTDDEYSGIVGKFENGKFTKNGNDLKIDDTNKKEAEYAFNYKFRQYCICGTTTDADKTKKKALRDELLALYDAFGGAATSDMSKKKEILESGKKAFGLN